MSWQAAGSAWHQWSSEPPLLCSTFCFWSWQQSKKVTTDSSIDLLKGIISQQTHSNGMSFTHCLSRSYDKGTLLASRSDHQCGLFRGAAYVTWIQAAPEGAYTVGCLFRHTVITVVIVCLWGVWGIRLLISELCTHKHTKGVCVDQQRCILREQYSHLICCRCKTLWWLHLLCNPQPLQRLCIVAAAQHFKTLIVRHMAHKGTLPNVKATPPFGGQKTGDPIDSNAI